MDIVVYIDRTGGGAHGSEARVALETAVHAWDATVTSGQPIGIEPELASEGIAEFFDAILLLTAASPRDLRGALRLEWSDVGRTWVVDLDDDHLPAARSLTTRPTSRYAAAPRTCCHSCGAAGIMGEVQQLVDFDLVTALGDVTDPQVKDFIDQFGAVELPEPVRVTRRHPTRGPNGWHRRRKRR